MSRSAHNNIDTARRAKAYARPQAFTMIELLVVIFILGILATLVVSVSTYIMDKGIRDQTIANQGIVLAAVAAYHDITDDYPPDNPGLISDPVWATVPPEASPGGYTLLYFLRGLEAAFANNDNLAMRIQKAATKSLLELPADAFDDTGFRDAYGQFMAYSRAGGMAGRPVIISPGADGDFNTTDDNIRSDGR